MISKLNTSLHATKFVFDIIKKSHSAIYDDLSSFINENGSQNLEQYIQILKSEIEGEAYLKPK